jgi:hypothetical protein
MAPFSRSWAGFSRRERLLLVLLTLWALFPLASVFGVGFESWRVGKVASFLFWLTPLLLLVLATQVRQRSWRIVATASMTFLVFLSAFPACFASVELTDMSHEQDPEFEPIWNQQRGASKLVLYRNNCGATCDFGLVLRQERRIAPGLRLVRFLESWYRAYAATVIPISPNRLRVEIAPYPDDRAKPIIDTVMINPSFFWP